jgi:HKD family nuclease
MYDTITNFVDEPLKTLLKAGKDYPNSDLAFSVAYVSAGGVLWLQNLLRGAKNATIIAGLCTINRVSAFLELQDLGVNLYVYVAESRKIFHPKIYYGATNAQAWAMVGSSNLTKNGLSLNVERNLFLTGQRLTEPFISIEAQIETFRTEAYFFDNDLKKKLTEIERRMRNGISEEEYLAKLIEVGIRPKARSASTLPIEVQQVALETLLEFARSTRLEYAYQILLMLIMLYRADEDGSFSQEEAASCFSRFYQLRMEAGLPAEKKRGGKSAVVDRTDLSLATMRRMIKTDPFLRFERKGLLDISDDNQYYIVNPALLAALTLSLRDELRRIAVQRLAEHFGESEEKINTLITLAIG